MRLLIFISALLIGLATSAANAEKRVALVIGNSAYQSVPPLLNPANDAQDMTAKLRSLGFEVTTGTDLDFRSMRNTVRKFVSSLPGTDIALLFYAGHGMQVNGTNYLLPVDATLKTQDDLEFDTLPMETILAAMERNAKTNIIFLDACRNNPLAEDLSRSMGTRSVGAGRGLAKVETAGIGSLISFSTQPGNVALDGDGRNSPFTSALLKHLGEPGVDIMLTMARVRGDVLKSTNRKQVPWDSSSLTDAVYLASMNAAAIHEEVLERIEAENNISSTLAQEGIIKKENSDKLLNSEVSKLENSPYLEKNSKNLNSEMMITYYWKIDAVQAMDKHRNIFEKYGAKNMRLQSRGATWAIILSFQNKGDAEKLQKNFKFSNTVLGTKIYPD